MRCLLTTSGSWMTVGVLALVLATPCRAAKEGAGHAKGEAGKAHAAKYKVVIDRDGKEVEKTVDPANPADAEEVAAALKAGHLKSFEEEHPVDPFGIKGWDLGIWTLVVFVILFFLLSRFAWPQILEGLHKREAGIRGAFDEAQKARDEAQRLTAEFNAKIAKSQEEVRALLDEARRDAETAKADILAQAHKQVEADRERLRREIDVARDQALKQLWNESATLATLISAKALKREVNADDHRRLVEEAIGEMTRAGREAQQQMPH